MARYATYLRASTDDQKTTHQHDAIDDWLSEHDVDHSAVDRFVDLAQSGADPGREQFTELVEATGTGEYEYVIIWEISRLARLGSIYQRFFEECEDAGTTVAITDGWVEEVRPDGTGKLIADISAAVAAEERRRLIKRTQAGVERAQDRASGSEPSRKASLVTVRATSSRCSIPTTRRGRSAISKFGVRSPASMPASPIVRWRATSRT